MESILRVPAVLAVRLAEAVKAEVNLAYSDECSVDVMLRWLCNRLGVSDEAELCLTFSTDPAGEEKMDVPFGMLCLLLKKASAAPPAERQTYRLHAELAPNATSKHAAPARRAVAAAKQPTASEAGTADAAATDAGSADEPNAPPGQTKKQKDWQKEFRVSAHRCMPQHEGKFVTVRLKRRKRC